MATSNDNQQGNKAGGKADQSGGSGGSKQSTGSKRGFASMDPAQQREIASEGGRAAHEKGTAHEFTSEEARRAGSMSHKNDGNRQSTGVAKSTSADNKPDKDGRKKSGGSDGQSGSGS